jgi:hypothetical protein
MFGLGVPQQHQTAHGAFRFDFSWSNSNIRIQALVATV